MPESTESNTEVNNSLLHLASASPRRREILTTLGLQFTFAGVEVDESPYENEEAGAMAVRLAVAKAAAAALESQHDRVILAADTVVTIGDTVFGKPESENDAAMMLDTLSGKEHRVLTGVAIHHKGAVRTIVSESSVRFREISPDEAHLYWQSGEPVDKAGAYAIQGKGAVFVKAVSGSYSGIVGLPVFETAQLLRDFGIVVLGSTGN